jgi:galactonate dehydratase
MKVTEIAVRRVPVTKRGAWLFVQVRTDEGLTGLGEASQSGDDEEMTHLLRSRVAPRVVDTDPRDVETVMRRLQGLGASRTGATAVSAVEQALWDLAGQAYGQPVWRLLGAKLRPRIWLYANINRSTWERTPEGFAANAKRAVAAGFRAVKLAPFDGMPRIDTPESFEAMELGIACLLSVREAVGPDVHVLLDAHCHFNAAWAVRVGRRLEAEGAKLFWFEDPVPRDDWEGLARVRAEIGLPVAAGETFFGLEPFWRLCTGEGGRPLVDVAMPDVKHCGGLGALRRIGALAEAAHVQIAPHNPSGPVAQLATVHACATLPSFTILEHAFGEADWRETLITPAEQLVDGYASVPDVPGLGVQLNEAAITEREVQE